MHAQALHVSGVRYLLWLQWIMKNVGRHMRRRKVRFIGFGVDGIHMFLPHTLSSPVIRTPFFPGVNAYGAFNVTCFVEMNHLEMLCKPSVSSEEALAEQTLPFLLGWRRGREKTKRIILVMELLTVSADFRCSVNVDGDIVPKAFRT